MLLLFYIFIFLFGLIIGSFLNCVIYRLKQEENLGGRSYCPSCRHGLAWFDLVPIFSFLFLGGRCRYCKRRLSWQYPVVEFLTGILFVTTYWYLANIQNLSLVSVLYLLIIICVLVVVTIVDLKHYLIPTTLTLAASLIALFYNYFFLNSGVFIDHIIAAFGAALFFALIVLVTLGRGMGEGDIFLACMIGMVLGLKGTLVAVFVAFVIGAIVAIFLVALGRKKFGQAVPFGPFLVLGFLASLFWGEFLLNWYLMLY